MSNINIERSADMPQAWADLIEALTIMARHAEDSSPTHCEHDRLIVMADPAAFTHDELDRLRALGFTPSDDVWHTFESSRFGSA